jgi:hypothetical protein
VAARGWHCRQRESVRSPTRALSPRAHFLVITPSLSPTESHRPALPLSGALSRAAFSSTRRSRVRRRPTRPRCRPCASRTMLR